MPDFLLKLSSKENNPAFDKVAKMYYDNQQKYA